MSCNNTGRASRFFKDCGCGCKGKKQEQKFIISTMSALVFFAVANPEVFRITRKVFGSWVSSPTGCPSTKGLVLHAFVFLMVTWALMNIKKERADGDTAIEPTPAEEEEEEPTLQQEEVAREEEDDGEFATFTPANGAAAPDAQTARLASVAVHGGQMSQAMGAPAETGMYPSPLKKGEYQQCRCSDGSSVTLMR
jgi:hypothetical protein